MSRFGVAALAPLFALVLGCSSSSSNHTGGSDPFVGTWTCNSSSTLTFTMPAGVQPQTSTSTTTDTITDTGGGTISIASADDGGANCAVKATVAGNTATLKAGQTCSAGAGASINYTGGTATLSGNTYTSSYQFTFSGTITVGGDAGPPQSVMVAGTGTGSDSCKKN